MPIAETSSTETERFTLSTAPADPNDPKDEQGYVVLRRLNYDEYLARRDMASKIKLSADEQAGGRRQYGQKGNQTAEVEMANKIVTEYEFRLCIVEHNLRRKDGALFDFKVPGILRILDPRIGDEIAYYIGQMNNFEPELAKGESPADDGPLQQDSEPASSSTQSQIRRLSSS